MNPVRLRLSSLCFTAAAVLLAGCAATPPRSSAPAAAGGVAAAAAPAPDGGDSPARDAGPIALTSKAATLPAAKPEIEKGTGKFINEEVARAPVSGGSAQEGEVTFNFENQPIQAVVKAFLGDLLRQNYVIAPGVQGNVTFATSRPIRADQAMPILEMLLSWTNNTLVWGEGRYTVVPVKDAVAGKLTPRLWPPGLGKGYEVRVFPLRYISPKEMEKLLKPYARSDAFVSVDTARSMLVLAGTPAELTNYQRTIDIFDVDWLKGMSVGVYPVTRVEVAKLMPELDKLFGAAGESPMAGMFRFLPIERTNSIVVITSNPDYLATAEEWLKRLDQAGSESGAQLYVYDVKNIKAGDLADRLSEVFSGQRSSSSSSRSSRGNVGPGLQPVQAKGGTNAVNSTLGGTGSSGVGGSMGNLRSGSQSDGGDSGSHAGSFKLGDSEDEVRISAVSENNQLLVMGTPSQWGIIESAIKRLDVQPLQVQIETKILEVSLNGNLSFGVQWYLEGLIGTAPGSPEGHNQPGNIQQGLLGSGGVSPPSSGLFYSYIGPEVQAAIRALETSGNTRIVSAPSLLVLNNREADIQVGTKIPVVQTFYNPGYGVINSGTTGTTGTTNYGFNSGSTQYLDTGIHLQVTPRVNPGGLVYLEVGQSVSKPGAKSDADISGNVPIEQRQLTTEIAVQSGQTVLLGGLIQDTTQDSENGIPGLSRIPILGRLFGSTTRSNQRTELLVLITPRVITSTEEASAVTDEYQRRFEGLRPLRNVRGAETRLQENKQ